MSKSNDVTQYYAKKYDFHKLLTSMLESEESKRKELLSKNPIIKTEFFLKYLQNQRNNLKDSLENP